jgi:predicted transglutaminase-like cysteine proteinase
LRVNQWVNRSIEYVEDRDLFARNDYWAGASRTMKLGRGDCEDIALTKMQLLAAAGVNRDDMILTIARDLVRGADHAVLIVKLDGRFVMLDNATDAIIDATVANDYRPILSYGQHQTWLHGYQTLALGQSPAEGLADRLE